MESDRTIATSSDGLSEGLQRIRPLHGRTTGPTRRSTKGQWTAEEDEILGKAVQRFKGKNWKKIAECFKDRTDVQCLHRWQKVLNPELIKGPWSKEEDEIIIQLVNQYGAKKWSTIAQHLLGRIGKQCRERWHNHLNPAINKEAWTQEEELALIRAHQIYGNKWAELTKFLPGRTDNSIKNHWNSSVKKKLDSYLASGLLAQFQGVPQVSHTNQSTASSRVQQCSGDDSIRKDGTEAEEISECSQGSTFVGCSQSTSDLANEVVLVHTREECLLAEESSHRNDPSSSPLSCSNNNHTAVQEVAYTILEVPCELGGSSNFIEHGLSHEWLNSSGKDWQLTSSELPNMSSLDLSQEPSRLLHCIDVNQINEVVPFPLQTSAGLNDSTSMGNMVIGSDIPEHMLISEDDCSRVMYPEEGPDGSFASENLYKCSNGNEVDGSTDSLLYQPSNCQIPHAGNVTSQSYYSLRPDMLGTSCCQSTCIPSQLPPDEGTNTYGTEPNQFNGLSLGNQEELLTFTHDGFIYTNGSGNFHFYEGPENVGAQKQRDQANGAQSNDIQSCPSVGESHILQTEQQDAGALSYEPPRFPSLDIPFFSCDLIQSGSDMQHEYSPLGIRQLMMSSVNCLSPYRLWDSPSRDNSPAAVLKSAAKTFTCTPSILKKRHRDLVSPLSEKRCEKKRESDSFANLARDFSRLEVIFDENVNQQPHPESLSSSHRRLSGAFSEDKENLSEDKELGKKEGSEVTLHNKIVEKEFDRSNTLVILKQGTDHSGAETKDDANAAAEIVQQPSGVLLEQNLNDLIFFSPDQFGTKSDTPMGPSARTLGNKKCKSSGVASNQGTVPESSSENPCLSVFSPHTICRKKGGSRVVASIQSAPSAPLDIMAENFANGAMVENLGIFGDTPFKRSIESPSAWKSPWFINSFLPGPRVDTDITIEDIGYFMSPGERSYDALGLMKQLGEHTASAFADAQEVLGDDTPDTILKTRCANNEEADQEEIHFVKSQQENNSLLASTVSTERRILDFSECGTPGKGTESGRSSTGISFSSPSSYLLKGCR